MEEDRIITEAKAIPNREAVEEFAVSEAMIKCSFGTGFDVINLPLCHGVYSGENPLLNISDMEVGKNIFGFGMCLDGKSECKCKEYIAINDKWMNPNETKLKIEKNEALLTGAQTACTSKGGIITITHSGQNAHYIKAAADQAKAIKAKKEAKATLDADTSSNDESVSKEVAPSIASDLASRSIVGGLGAIVSAGAFVDKNTAPSDNLEQKIVIRTSKNSATNTLESNDPMSKVLIPSMASASIAKSMIVGEQKISLDVSEAKGGTETIMALNKLYSYYDTYGNLSGLDATTRAIHKVQEKNSIDLSEYTFASDDITTTVSVIKSNTFSLNDIHELHKNDDKMTFIAGATPGSGPVMGPLFSYITEIEQNGESSIVTTTKNVALSALGSKYAKVGLLASGVDTKISLIQDKSDTYYRDGVRIQEGDSYILLQTKTNQGLDVASIKVYVRDDKIISYEKFGPYGSQSYPSYDLIIQNKWKAKGYK